MRSKQYSMHVLFRSQQKKKRNKEKSFFCTFTYLHIESLFIYISFGTKKGQRFAIFSIGNVPKVESLRECEIQVKAFK